jgi:hypothetical protein
LITLAAGRRFWFWFLLRERDLLDGLICPVFCPLPGLPEYNFGICGSVMLSFSQGFAIEKLLAGEMLKFRSIVLWHQPYSAPNRQDKR